MRFGLFMGGSNFSGAADLAFMMVCSHLRTVDRIQQCKYGIAIAISIFVKGTSHLRGLLLKEPVRICEPFLAFANH